MMKRFMPEDWALPALDDRNRDFFTSGKIALQECASCGTVQHPPEEVCHGCRGLDFAVRAVKGLGVVYSYVVVHHAANRALRDRVPYAVVLVALDEAPAVRIVGNLLNVGVDRIRIGMRVRAVWEEIEADGETLKLPQWMAIEGTP
jgi:uncharacterized OB-fold protein